MARPSSRPSYTVKVKKKRPVARRQPSADSLDLLTDAMMKLTLREKQDTFSFLNLPDELQKSVLDYVTLYSDLRSLCEVSKKLQALTLPYLYRTVVLDPYAFDYPFLSVFTVDHPGLAHIRHVRVQGKSPNKRRFFDFGKDSRALHHLISIIPRNRLRTFEVPLGARDTQELEVRLRVRQQQLRNYQHYPRGLSTIAVPPILDRTNHVTCLQLFSGNVQDLQLARLLFERMTAVTHLTITVRYHPDWKNTTHGPRFADITTIFAAGSAFGRTTKVRHLRLEGVTFYEMRTSLPEVFPFDDLSHLHLYRCISTDVLCESLGRLKMDLQSFCDENPCNQSQPGALDAFLRSIPPLRQLRIVQNKFANGAEIEGFDWTALTTHAPKMRCLELDDFELWSEIFVDTTRNLPDFQTFCKSASDLQQLSIIGPNIEEAAWSFPYGLYTLICCLRNLRSLKLLKLLVNPKCIEDQRESLSRSQPRDGDTEDTTLFRLARDQVKAAADQIFDSLAQACPGLIAIVVDYEVSHALRKRVGILRSRQTDLAGNTKFVGHIVDIATLKDSVPDHEMSGAEVNLEY